LASIEENIRYLLTGCIRKEAAVGFPEACREIIKNEFFPERGDEKLRYIMAKNLSVITRKLPRTLKGRWTLCSICGRRRQIHQYLRDIDERFYLNIYGYCQRSATSSGKKELYLLFRKRLFKVCKDSRKIGCGFGDMVSDIIINFKLNLEGK